MSVGYPQDKQAIDAAAGRIATNIRNVFDDIGHMETFLSGKQDTDLTALGYSQADVTLLKSAFTQLQQMVAVATGQGTQATANNFLFFSNQLTGPN